jgi:hypothetical protein
MQANAMSYQPEPDDEIRLGCDILPPRNVSHSICGIAGVDEEHGRASYWMILLSCEL